jgi:16S rRNA processing protein RimM
MPAPALEDLLLLGRIGQVYGIKGWVKVISHTKPKEGILTYPNWWVKSGNKDWQSIKPLSGKPHGKGLVAQLDGCFDRDTAQGYCGADIAVERSLLPVLDDGDYYWHQLEGLSVTHCSADGPVLLGRVDHLMETGSNDVLVLRACEGSVDDNERLIPYLIGRVIKKIDLEVGEIQVDWDPEY